MAIKRLTEMGGTGGVIGLDASGYMVMEFNTEGMYRGIVQGGKIRTYIY